MHFIYTVKKKYALWSVLSYVGLLLLVTLTAYRPSPGSITSGHKSTDHTPATGSTDVPTSYWGPLPLKLRTPAFILANDPIRFSIQCNKQAVRLGEFVELTITAELLNISPNLLFFPPGSTAYTLKMLLPPGFEQTGGDFADIVTDELTYPAHPLATYHIRGYFRSVTPGTDFRLLRGQKQADDHGLFVEKAAVVLQRQSDESTAAHPKTTWQANLTTVILYVTTDNSMAAGAARIAAAEYRGLLDYAACDKIRGWVADTKNLRQSQSVDIYVNGIKVATVRANLIRQDVATVLGVNDFNEYGYVWVVPDYYKYNVPLTLSVRPANGSANLSGSPRQTSPCYSTGIAAPTPRGSTTPPATTITATPPATATTVASPTPATPLANFRRAVVIGNSFTAHPASRTINWFLNNGMAASSPANDYVHRIETALKGVNPSFEMLALGSGSGLEGLYHSADEQVVDNNITNIRFEIEQRYGEEKADLFIVSISENVNDVTFDETKFRLMLDKLMAGLADKLTADATILFRNGLWLNHEKADVVLKNYAQSKGYKFADMADLKETRVNGVPTWAFYATQFSDGGVRRHPNDAGHAAIANRFLGQLIATTTPPTTTPAPPVVAALPYDYPTVPDGTVGGWTSTNPRVLRGGNGSYAIGPVVRMESAKLLIELRKNYGGALQIKDKRTNRQIINYSDWGRQSEITVYGGPLNYASSRGATGTWKGIGWNPIGTGNYQDVPAQVIASGWVTGNDKLPRFYTKTRMISWPSGAVGSAYPPDFLEAWIEKWTRLTGDEVAMKTRTTFARKDQTFYEARGQEYPCMMTVGSQSNIHYYTGSAPYTNDTGGYLKSTNTREKTNTAFTQSGFFISEPWLAIEYDQAGHYLFKNTERMGYETSTLYIPDQVETDENANACTYTASGNLLTVDANGTWYHDYSYYVTDNFKAGRTWANAKPRTHGDVPNWTFSQAKGRNDWSISHGIDQKEPFTSDHWKPVAIPSSEDGTTNLNARRSLLASPVVIHKANKIPIIYLRMKYSGQASELQITFIRNGQRDRELDGDKPKEMNDRHPNGAVSGATQRLVFNPIRDGQFHTYAIQTNQTPEWKDVIQQYFIQYTSGSPIRQNEPFEVAYFGVNNPGD